MGKSTAQREFQAVGHAAVKRYGPGEAAPHFEAGDFILTHGDAWTSKVIRFGQKLRIRGDDAKYTHWNHAALVINDRGDIIEALGAGVIRRNVDKYRPEEYYVVCTGASQADRDQVVKFAEWAAGDIEGNGRMKYGFAIIVSIAYTLITGGKFSFGLEGQVICSGLVARALERTDAIFNRSTTHIMPADLAKYYEVEPPA